MSADFPSSSGSEWVCFPECRTITVVPQFLMASLSLSLCHSHSSSSTTQNNISLTIFLRAKLHDVIPLLQIFKALLQIQRKCDTGRKPTLLFCEHSAAAPLAYRQPNVPQKNPSPIRLKGLCIMYHMTSHSPICREIKKIIKKAFSINVWYKTKTSKKAKNINF